MPRRPLPIGTWGRISRTPVTRVDGRDVTLEWLDRKAWLGGVAVKPDAWVARARFRDVDGVTRKVEAWGASAGRAEAALVDAMKERAATSSTEITPDTRVAALADFWLRTKVEASDKLSTNTKTKYSDIVTKHVVPGVGGLLLREVNVARMARFVEDRQKNVGTATAKTTKSVLTSMFTLAATHNAIAANPMREVGAVEETGERAEVRAMTTDELKAMRADLASDTTAKRQDLPDLVDVLLATGARIGEVLALRWEDVDLEANTVTICGTVVRGRGGLVRQGHTKGKRDRVLTVPAFAVALLKRRAEDGLPGGELGVVFPSAVAGLREVATLEKAWRSFRTRHPVWKWVTFHTFRKTVATTLEREVGVKDAAVQLGHTSDALTTKHYVERLVAAPDHSDVLERLSA